MHYQDFVLLLDLTPAGRVRARVIEAPGGEGESEFPLPVSAEDRARLEAMATDGAARGGSVAGGSDARGFRPVVDPIRPEPFLEQLGERMFESVFRGSVRTAWDRSLGVVGAGGGLRLKLQMALDDARGAALHEIPWEYLYSAANGGYLAQQRRTPVLRHLRVMHPPAAAPAPKPLRVLVVSCQPEALSPLALERERENLERAWGRAPGVEVKPLVQPSLEEVRQHLLQHSFHVLHFMGHGGYEGEGGRGDLYFAGEDGEILPLSGKVVASHLRGFPSLRLVFLNACDTARAGGAEPLAGVATALVAAGIPAVIAMQMPVPDAVALTFSRRVYGRLAEGDPIEAAVSEGRLAITGMRTGVASWGIPVLFLRAGDGRLFAADEPPPPRATVTPPEREMFTAAVDPPAPRSKRFIVVIALSLALTVAGLTAVMQPWKSRVVDHPTEGVPQEKPLSSTGTSDGTAEKQQEEMKHPVEPHSETGREATSRTRPATTQPQGAANPASTESTQKTVVEPIQKSVAEPPPPPSNVPVIVAAGSSAYLPAMKARVSVSFFEQAGFKFARFSLSPEGEGMLQQPPVMGPGPITFAGAKGSYVLEVLNLDFEGRSAEVQGFR